VFFAIGQSLGFIPAKMKVVIVIRDQDRSSYIVRKFRIAGNRFPCRCGDLNRASAKIKYLVRGYLTPKTVNSNDVDGCVEHAREIAQLYLAHVDVKSGHVLEPGPGSDLGVGILLRQAGAKLCGG
jgi:hypothetical protein